MIFLLQPKVLTIGLEEKNQVLEELSVHLIKCIGGFEAAGYLKREKVDSVITAWNLPDMPGGLFIKRLRAVKPDVPCIVFIDSGDTEQEIAARSCGASVVLTDKTDDDFFRGVVLETMRLPQSCIMEEAHPRITRSSGIKGIKTDKIESKHGIE